MTSISTVGSTDASSYLSSLSTAKHRKGGGKMEEDFETLQKALDSGDLSAAKTAFATIQDAFKKGPGGGSDGSGSEDSSTSSASGVSATRKGPDLSALQSALESGDLSAAKTALTDLQKNAPKGPPPRGSGASSEGGQVGGIDGSTSIDAFLQALESGSSSSSSWTGSSTTSTDPFGYSGQALDLFA